MIKRASATMHGGKRRKPPLMSLPILEMGCDLLPAHPAHVLSTETFLCNTQTKVCTHFRLKVRVTETVSVEMHRTATSAEMLRHPHACKPSSKKENETSQSNAQIL